MSFLPGDSTWSHGCFGVGLMLGAVLLAMATGLALIVASNPPTGVPADAGAGGPGAGQPGGPAGPGAANQIPAISAREFTGGSSAATVSGAFALDPTVRFETGGDSDGQRAHIEYWVGYEALPDPAITLVMGAGGGEPNHLEVYSGEWSATDRGDGCTWQATVTATTVTGHVSCPAITARNLNDGSTGTVSVELDFVANSP